MLNYADALIDLDTWSIDVAPFERWLKQRNGTSVHEWNARNDMLFMIEHFHRYLAKLHTEATVCRQRKKITPAFEKLYRRATEYRDVVESNRVMYSLMFA